jgi:molybdopterin converting factor small subunit
MVTFQIAGYLTEFTSGDAEIKIDAAPATVRDALSELWERYVGLRDRVLTEQGAVRQHVNIFVNSSIVRRDQVLDAPLQTNAEICIMPAVSGGSEPSGSPANLAMTATNLSLADTIRSYSRTTLRLRSAARQSVYKSRPTGLS